MENNSNLCNYCNQRIINSDFVEINQKLYHFKCFKCSLCSKQLTKENFRMKDEILYCKFHYLQQIYTQKENFELKKSLNKQYSKPIQNSSQLSQILINSSKDLLSQKHQEEQKLFTSNDNKIKIDCFENDKFKKEFEKAKKEALFEYRIIGLISNTKSSKDYYDNKKTCPNCKTKFLFQGIKIDYFLPILQTNFKIGRFCLYGLGIYFTDQLDYVRCFTDGTKDKNIIPRVGQALSLMTAEVYYDKNKLKRIYNYNYQISLDHFPSNDEIIEKYQEKTVEKNGIHFIEVIGDDTRVIDQNNQVESKEPLPKNIFVGKKFVVTSIEQILPLYGLIIERTEYCVIWRDSNFYNQKNDLEEMKNFIHSNTLFNLYVETGTRTALELIWKKKYNKIILITNVGENEEGKLFVDKVRKILGFNVVVLFFDFNDNHLNWIKDYPNSLYSYSNEHFKDYIINFNEVGLIQLKEKIEVKYGVPLQDFSNHLEYPLFKQFEKGGLYSDLDCSNYNFCK